MTTDVHSSTDPTLNALSARLMDSAITASRNAMTEIDWTIELDPHLYGCSPEWSALYGTDHWNELTEDQRVRATRHEIASVMTIGIWFEMSLQKLVLRDQAHGPYHQSEFAFALTEVADECRHSLMFSLASQRVAGTSYHPNHFVSRLSRFFMNVLSGAAAYAGILVAEEILDVLQRGSSHDERVLPLIRTVNDIHVLEESRHMRFAREQVRESLKGSGRIHREISAILVALSGQMVAMNLVRPQAYRDAGLDVGRAIEAMRTNEHYQSMLRGSCTHLMQFLDEVGLLTPTAQRIYRKVHLL